MAYQEQPAPTEADSKSKAQPSGHEGSNPPTADPGQTGVRSTTPENAANRLNPSSPGETGTTPGSNAK